MQSPPPTPPNPGSNPYSAPPTPPPGVHYGAYAEGLTTEDRSNLDTLSLCYKIYAWIILGLGLLSCIFPFCILMPMMVNMPQQGGGGAPIAVMLIPMLIGIVIGMGINVALAVLYFKAAAALKETRSNTLCIVAAVFACMNVPLGTILGVFTFVVINRPQVKAAFDNNR